VPSATGAVEQSGGAVLDETARPTWSVLDDGPPSTIVTTLDAFAGPFGSGVPPSVVRWPTAPTTALGPATRTHVTRPAKYEFGAYHP
jgi:hypothetical protein